MLVRLGKTTICFSCTIKVTLSLSCNFFSQNSQSIRVISTNHNPLLVVGQIKKNKKKYVCLREVVEPAPPPWPLRSSLSLKEITKIFPMKEIINYSVHFSMWQIKSSFKLRVTYKLIREIGLTHWLAFRRKLLKSSLQLPRIPIKAFNESRGLILEHGFANPQVLWLTVTSNPQHQTLNHKAWGLGNKSVF